VSTGGQYVSTQVAIWLPLFSFFSMGNEATSARVAFVAIAVNPVVVGLCGLFLLPDLLGGAACFESAYLATPCTVQMGSRCQWRDPCGTGAGVQIRAHPSSLEAGSGGSGRGRLLKGGVPLKTVRASCLALVGSNRGSGRHFEGFRACYHRTVEHLVCRAH
jgi:hypothetical protein